MWSKSVPNASRLRWMFCQSCSAWASMPPGGKFHSAPEVQIFPSSPARNRRLPTRVPMAYPRGGSYCLTSISSEGTPVCADTLRNVPPNAATTAAAAPHNRGRRPIRDFTGDEAIGSFTRRSSIKLVLGPLGDVPREVSAGGSRRGNAVHAGGDEDRIDIPVQRHQRHLGHRDAHEVPHDLGPLGRWHGELETVEWALGVRVAPPHAVPPPPAVRRARDAVAAQTEIEELLEAPTRHLHRYDLRPELLVSCLDRWADPLAHVHPKLFPADDRRRLLPLGPARSQRRYLERELPAVWHAHDPVRPATEPDVKQLALRLLQVVRILRNGPLEVAVDVVERRDDAVGDRRQPARRRLGDRLPVHGAVERPPHPRVEQDARVNAGLAVLREDVAHVAGRPDQHLIRSSLPALARAQALF